MTDTSPTPHLIGKRVVVVGASSGIGAGVASLTASAGAEVVVAARRVERLEALAEASPNVQAVALDLCEEASRAEFAAAVKQQLTEIDVLFVSAGAAPLRRFEATTEEEWLKTLRTNVIGVHQTVASLIPLLSAGSVTVIVSSEVVQSPRSYLGVYGASKAALDHMMRQWAEEHPWLRFTTVSLGATMPTEFGSDFDNSTIMEALNDWTASGRNQSTFMETSQVCQVLVDTIDTLLGAPTVNLENIVMRSPSPPQTDLDAMVETLRQTDT